MSKLATSVLLALVVAFPLRTALAVGDIGGGDVTVPPYINHEGILMDSDGVPLEGQVTIEVRLYDSPFAGEPLWWDSFQLELIDGYYMIPLGGRDLIDFFMQRDNWRDGLFLGISVDGGDEILPRYPLSSVPFAIVSQDVVGDINPHTVSVNGILVIDEAGRWVGPGANPGEGDEGSDVGGGQMTGREILAALAPVDGQGSGLDADMLDGMDSSSFLIANDPGTRSYIVDIVNEVTDGGSGGGGGGGCADGPACMEDLYDLWTQVDELDIRLTDLEREVDELHDGGSGGGGGGQIYADTIYADTIYAMDAMYADAMSANMAMFDESVINMLQVDSIYANWVSIDTLSVERELSAPYIILRPSRGVPAPAREGMVYIELDGGSDTPSNCLRYYVNGSWHDLCGAEGVPMAF